MPQVNHQHPQQAFPYPLPPQKSSRTVTKKQRKSPPVVTPEKRRRDSLMANRKMRYVLSNTGKIHDRDCPHVKQIPDAGFSMCEDYPNGRYVCFVCYRKALVRRGLALDLTKYIDAAIRFFHKVGATSSHLNLLFLQHDAQIYRIEADSVYLKVNEDRWCIQIAENGCLLYHNNYQLLEGNQRWLESDFHLQVPKAISFQNAVVTMCQYTWSGHIQIMEARQKALRQDNLRKQLSDIPCYQPVNRRSLLFRYFLLAVPMNCTLKLPCHVAKKELYPSGSIYLCRLPKWKASSISVIAQTIQEYCIEKEHFNYVQFCLQTLSDTEKSM